MMFRIPSLWEWEQYSFMGPLGYKESFELGQFSQINASLGDFGIKKITPCFLACSKSFEDSTFYNKISLLSFSPRETNQEKWEEEGAVWFVNQAVSWLEII